MRLARSMAALAAMVPLAAPADTPTAEAVQTSSTGSPDAAAYEQLKALSGRWRGRIAEPADGGPIEMVYEVVSGGQAVIERMFAGTTHEMVTVYFLANGRLQATHYCSAGNQPAYRLASFRDGMLVFDFAGGTGFDPKSDPHAHGTTLRVTGPDRLESSWSFYEGEAPSGSARSLLERVRS